VTRAGDAWCSKNSDACACIVLLAPVGPPAAPFCNALLPAHSAPLALRATAINTSNGVRGRGGAAARVDGGVVKGRQCA